MDDMELLEGTLESRLLFCTKADFIDHIGAYRLKSQSFRTVFPTPFERKAVRCALEEEVQEVSQGRIDLESVVEDYKAASKLYQAVKRSRYFKGKSPLSYEQRVFKLLEDVIPMRHYPISMSPSEQNLYERIYDKEEDQHRASPAVLALMMLGHLPGYRNRCDVTDIEKDALAMLDALEGWEWGDFVNIDYYRAFVKRAANKRTQCGLPLLNRCVLISLVNEIFFLLGADEEDWRLKYSQYVSDNTLWQDIDTPCLWLEKSGTDEARNTFYRLMKAADCFFVFKNTISDNIIHTEKDELRLMLSPSLLPGVLLRNLESDHNKMNNEVFLFGLLLKPDYFKCVISDDDDTKTFFDNSLQLSATIHPRPDYTVKDVVFHYRDSTGPHSRTFVPVSLKSDTGKYKELAGRDLWYQHVASGIRCFMHRTMVAITDEYLYFGIPTDSEARRPYKTNRYVGYYKVPIDLFGITPLLISFQEPFGHVIFDYEEQGRMITRTFIGHAATEQYYEVTTQEKCRENGIERLDRLPGMG